MGSEMAKELAGLERLTVGRLRERYAEAFGEPTNGSNRPWLVRRIAWRLQERAEGGLSERAKRRAEELADDADLRVLPPRTGTGRPAARTAMPDPAPLDRRLPVPGTVLTRPYKGGVLSQAGTRAGYGTDMSQWSGPAIELAVAETKAFKARLAGNAGHNPPTRP
jgi:Protein of unknown function (DUF2924)